MSFSNSYSFNSDNVLTKSYAKSDTASFEFFITLYKGLISVFRTLFANYYKVKKYEIQFLSWFQVRQ